jgi:hypothetical protein
MAARQSRRRRLGGALALLGMLLSRVLLAAFLVFATYNPGGASYVHWLRANAAGPIWHMSVWQAIVTVLLLLAYGVVLPVTLRALGLGGIALAASVATGSIWLLLDHGLLSVAGPRAPAWIALSVAAFVLGVGLSWLTIITAWNGQLSARNLTQ